MMVDIEPNEKYRRFHPDSAEARSAKARVAVAERNPGTEVEPYIQTLEGVYSVRPDDFIVTGVKGERYPCESEIFLTTYSPLEDVCPA